MSSTVNDDKSTNKMEALQRLHNHAASLGGECLARKYDNSRTKVLWRCKHGHQWLALPSAVLKTSGTWCPDCAADDKKLGLSVLQAHARSLGGQCLAAAYDNARTKVSWQCKLGHEWRATTDSVLRRHSWCPECALESRYVFGRHVQEFKTEANLAVQVRPHVERIHQLRAAWANMVSTMFAERTAWYTNRFSKVLWRCRHGHEWQAMPAKVVREGTWCPHCAKKAPVPWARLQAHAATFGGQCLMANYQNLRHKLTWRCKEGHKWMATGGNVLHGGTWCPQCAAKNRALRAEPEVRRIFEEIFFTAKFKTSFPRFLSGLQLDGHCAEMHLAFEYQGEQHYDPDHFFHSRDPQGFSKQRERDARKDKRTFIQLALLRWFTVRQAQHVIPGDGLSTARPMTANSTNVPPQWLAFQGNFEPPTKPKAQVSPRMKSSKAERKVDLQTMDHIRVLHYE
ncbi:unnamed protein product, partial [Symbiodinium sp. KB8]